MDCHKNYIMTKKKPNSERSENMATVSFPHILTLCRAGWEMVFSSHENFQSFNFFVFYIGTRFRCITIFNGKWEGQTSKISPVIQNRDWETSAFHVSSEFLLWFYQKIYSKLNLIFDNSALTSQRIPNNFCLGIHLSRKHRHANTSTSEGIILIVHGAVLTCLKFSPVLGWQM